jgi:hypothetical protein
MRGKKKQRKNSLRLIWKPQSPLVSRPFPWLFGPLALLPKVCLTGRLEVSPVEICHRFSRGFGWAEILISLGREMIHGRPTHDAQAPLPLPPHRASPRQQGVRSQSRAAPPPSSDLQGSAPHFLGLTEDGGAGEWGT